VNLYEAVLRRSYASRYTTDREALEPVRAAATARMGEALAVLEAAIDPGPFLLGARTSVADVYVAMLFNWYRGVADVPQLVALRDGVRRQPTVEPIWQRHFRGQ